MRYVRPLVALAALAAVALAFSVPRTSTAAWREETSFTADTLVPGALAPPAPPPVQPAHPLGPIVPAEGTHVQNATWVFPEPNSTGNTCVDIDVQATGGGSWSFGFLFDAPPLWGATTNVWGAPGGVSVVDETDRRVFSGSGSSQFRLCMDASANPPLDEDRFVVAQSEAEWMPATSIQACVDLTVRSVDTAAVNPFFVSWVAVLDLRAAYALFAEHNRTPTYLSLAGQGEFFTAPTTPLGTDEVTLTSTVRGAIRADHPRVIHACLNGS